MKNIASYNAEKYNSNGRYTAIEDGIYLLKNEYDFVDDEGLYVYGNMRTSSAKPDYYVTSLSFEQEPELGEGSSSHDITQYPLEDVLNKFFVHVQDFYDEINDGSSSTCYLEFASERLEDIKKLRSIIGCHVYNKEYEDNGRAYIKLIIE